MIHIYLLLHKSTVGLHKLNESQHVPQWVGAHSYWHHCIMLGSGWMHIDKPRFERQSAGLLGEERRLRERCRARPEARIENIVYPGLPESVAVHLAAF